MDKGFNPKAEEGPGAQSSRISKKSRRLHKGECLASSNAGFKCSKSGYQTKDYRVVVRSLKDREYKVKNMKEVLNAPNSSMPYMLGKWWKRLLMSLPVC